MSHSARADHPAQADHTTASFLRALTLGAFIGAIIAGSSLRTRRRRRRGRSGDDGR